MRGLAPVAATLALVIHDAAFAATYYVAPGGDDDNDGSSGAPWQTLQHAASTAGGGDVFVGGANGDDYHLRAGSLAIGKALAARAPATDLEGTARDGMPDVGAYEATGGTPPVDAAPPSPVDARTFDARLPVSDARVFDARVIDAAPGAPDARVVDAPPAASDAGVPVDAGTPATGDSSGCSCRAGSGSSGVSAALALLAFVALRRRRMR